MRRRSGAPLRPAPPGGHRDLRGGGDSVPGAARRRGDVSAFTPSTGRSSTGCIRYARETVLDDKGNKRNVFAGGRCSAYSDRWHRARRLLRQRSAIGRARSKRRPLRKSTRSGGTPCSTSGDDDASRASTSSPEATISRTRRADQTKTRRYFRDLARDADKLCGPANGRQARAV